MAKSADEVGMAEFKAKATKLLPRVARTGRVLRVLKRGKVLVEVHPPRAAKAEPFVGRARGAVTTMGDVLRPIDEAWEANAD
ncbi:MAG: type II toxin-antitoxin system Phd/YefM family antitoxin [Gemmatimonadales bacterium]